MPHRSIADALTTEAMTQLAAAGKLHVLDLEDIKRRLGDRWEQLNEIVHAYFERRIREEMSKDDLCFKVGELSYVVVFRHLSFEESRLRCLKISQEISKRLFGENGLEAAVRNMIGNVDVNEIARARDPGSVINHIIELEGHEEIVGPLPYDDRSSFKVDDRQTLYFESNPETDFEASLSSLTFLYHPFWDARRQVVLSYLCQAVPESSAERSPTDGILAARLEEAQAAIDTLILRECCRRIAKLHDDQRRLLIGCPLHFGTVSRSKHWQQYAKLCQSVPSAVAKDLFFVVHGIEAGLPQIRLIQELPKLRKSCRHVFCVVNLGRSKIGPFSGTGCDGVGIALSSNPLNASETEAIQRMRRLAAAVEGQGVDCFVLGLSSTSLLLNALTSGIRYVQGSVIGAPEADPKRAYVHELTDLYDAHLRADGSAAAAR